MGLLDDLISYWKLNEESGARNDSHGGHHLTDLNTVGFAAGKQGNAAQLVSANTEALKHNGNSALSTGDTDFTVACWAYFDTLGSDRDLMTKVEGSLGANSEYILEYTNGLAKLAFTVYGSGGAVSVTADSIGTPSVSTWYFVVAWHDSVGNTVNIQVNNGTVHSVSHSAGVNNGGANSDFNIGAAVDIFRSMNGRIDEAGFWKRLLTADERTYLYNGGDGQTYPFTAIRPVGAALITNVRYR